jgi:hypothetical protein
MWDSFTGADMYGAVNCCPKHLQAWFIAFDMNPRTWLFLRNFWNCFQKTPEQTPTTYEALLSEHAASSGLVLNSYLTDTHIDYTFGPDGEWTDPELWNCLIDELRLPFLKRKIMNHPMSKPIRDFIVEQTSYPLALIR